MTNDVMLFRNEEFGEIRSLNIDGEPWFVGKDVAEALGYNNSRDAIRKHIDTEDKGVANCDTLGGEQELTIINESGLYSLILSSRLESAKKFKRWVTTQILPAIRKHGAYATDETLEKALTSPEFGIRLLTALKDERDKVQKLEVENAFLSVKAKYYDAILNSTNSVPVTQIAKDYGMTAIAFNQLLHGYKIQYPIRNSWVLFAEYADKGYTQSRTFPINDKKSVMHTYWTQKGRLFLYDFLKERGILPACEQ